MALFLQERSEPRLDSRVVYLRPPRRRDWRAWAELRAMSRDFLVPWEPAWSSDALTRAAFRRRLGRQAEDWERDQGYAFFIFRQADDALLGGINLNNVRRGVAQMTSLGYWIGQPHIRHGYMSEALKPALVFAFEHLGLHRCEAACLPANRASQSVLRRSGFREEGLAKRYLRINGEWQDHVLFALLREEAQAQGLI
ncbi:MAG: GNAT family N-acetyltransferase [Proteobacteria bacterium]|nr:GNAT family N-acetyltransferase [Pseudomonadota bacterium]MBI3496539.1 GNAT family N-acetyltransferase [Pseudomonadota bacterium]